ncbi:hypothetical protein DYB28_002786 [Aphanomyces astaci]|uniref:Uncharacterized protein n=1 Tax=Aphanomyces astaci TaxID=112090 RepID=A0A397B7C8_APHAT|nr:hypothetical protein DYB25_002799 [Aphanomyces astaci]RLO00756.1 hypothetical protein DYB28_002786 [Aphanomyces astaci]
MARGSTKAELEAEVEKLREYKTLTKLRMKQAAEKLGSYRVQLEECQATIESLKESVTSQHQTIEHQAKTIRALTDKVMALCLTKTVKNLVAHHHVPVPAIAAAVLKIGSKSVIESTVCVDLLWQVTHPRRADLLMVLHAIGSHVRKTFNRHNTQVQASWCRVHVLLCRRATWIAASRSFLVDRLLEVNRSIWDFVTMVQSWPQIFAQLGDGDDNVTAAATSSLLPTTIRFLMGNMCREEEAKAKDNNAEYFSELYRVCRLDPPLSDDWYLDKFQARFEMTTFETCESVRLLLRVQGWQWCADHHIVPDKPDDQLTPTALRIAAATALVELAQGVPTKALRTEYVAAVVRWFQGQSPTGQLSQSTSFVRQLHHVVAMDVA